MLTDRRPPSLAESATESATPASVSSATAGDAETDERTQRRRSHCFPETDGSLLLLDRRDQILEFLRSVNREQSHYQGETKRIPTTSETF